METCRGFLFLFPEYRGTFRNGRRSVIDCPRRTTGRLPVLLVSRVVAPPRWSRVLIVRASRWALEIVSRSARAASNFLKNGAGERTQKRRLCRDSTLLFLSCSGRCPQGCPQRCVGCCHHAIKSHSSCAQLRYATPISTALLADSQRRRFERACRTMCASVLRCASHCTEFVLSV